MYIRRIATAAVALLAVAGMVFAGGSSESSRPTTTGGKVVLKVMAYGDNSNREGQDWKTLVENFERANPNIDIQDEMLYDQAYHQKVEARLAAGDVPDIGYMWADALGQAWRDAGVLVDHRPLLDASYFDMSLIPGMGPNGEVWYPPLGTANMTTVLFMNEELVKSMGFAAPKTYADLKAMVPAARAAGKEVIAFAGAEGWVWNSCLLSALVARFSGDVNWVSKAVAGQFKFTDPAFVQSLTFLKTMIADGVLSESAVLTDYGTSLANYVNGNALFMLDGQWRAGGLVDTPVEGVTKLMALPQLPGEKIGATVAAAIPTGYGMTTVAAADPAKREAAIKFIRFFNSVEETTQRLVSGAIVAPILKNFQWPADIAAINVQKADLAKIVKISDVVDAYVPGEANNALNAGMQNIVTGQATPADVAAQVEALVRK